MGRGDRELGLKGMIEGIIHIFEKREIVKSFRDWNYIDVKRNRYGLKY